MLSSNSGVVRLVKLPKSVSHAPLELNVSVSDGVHVSFCTVAVDFLAESSGAPVFPSHHYEVSALSEILAHLVRASLRIFVEPNVLGSSPGLTINFLSVHLTSKVKCISLIHCSVYCSPHKPFGYK